jgi:hypothetical protein
LANDDAEETPMTDEKAPPQVDLEQQAIDILLAAQNHLEDALLRNEQDEMWKAIASVNTATQGLKIAQLISRVQALEGIVQVLLKEQSDDLQQQVVVSANAEPDASMA